MVFDLTGQRFGKLTALHPGEANHNGIRPWVCQCDCGQITEGHTHDLFRGRKKTCSFCRPNKPANVLGKRFGKLVVLSKVKPSVETGRGGWLCQCDCGKSKVIGGSELQRGKRTSCGKCLPIAPQLASLLPLREAPGFKGQAAFNTLYVHYQGGAVRRKISFELTKEQFYPLTQQNCYYCGLPPSQESKNKHLRDTYIYTGIDRVDNTRGYSIDNVRPCCKQCNNAKGTLTEQEFYDWIQRVSTHLGKLEVRQ